MLRYYDSLGVLMGWHGGGTKPRQSIVDLGLEPYHSSKGRGYFYARWSLDFYLYLSARDTHYLRAFMVLGNIPATRSQHVQVIA